MSNEARTSQNAELVPGDLSTAKRLAMVPVALWFPVFGLSCLVFFRFADVDGSLFGLPVGATIVGSVAVGSLVLAVLPVLSRTGVLDVTPSPTTGPTFAGEFGIIGFVAGAGTVATVTDLGVVGWLPGGVLVGGLVFLLVASATEDIGTTVPPAVLGVGFSALVFAGYLGPSWSWNPSWLSATFTPTIVVPFLATGIGLLVAQGGAGAFAGFGSRGRQASVYFLLRAAALVMLGLLAVLIAYTILNGHETVLDGIEVGPGLHFHWPFIMDGYDIVLDKNGIFPAIMGTFWLVLGAFVFAVPLAIGAAVFVSEIVEQGRFTAGVEIVVNALWSTPSIVFGLFGFAFLVPRLGNNLSLLAGMFTLGFMLLPLVIITSREAIKSVPDEYRDASAALGVTRWETIKSVVIPAALPGIITGIILGIGRIAGETAPILLVTAGGVQNANAPNVLGSFQITTSPPFITNHALMEASTALPYQLYATITAGVSGNEAYGWGTALVLLGLVLSFYAIGIISRLYFRRKLHQ